MSRAPLPKTSRHSKSSMSQASRSTTTASPITDLLEHSLGQWLLSEMTHTETLSLASVPRTSALCAPGNNGGGVALPTSSANAQNTSRLVRTLPTKTLAEASTDSLLPGLSILTPSLATYDALSSSGNTQPPIQASQTQTPSLRDSSHAATESTTTISSATNTLYTNVKRAADPVSTNSSAKRPRDDSTLVPTAAAAEAEALSRVKVSALAFRTHPTNNHDPADGNFLDCLRIASPKLNDCDGVERALLDEFASASFYHACQPCCLLLSVSRQSNNPVTEVPGQLNVYSPSINDDNNDDGTSAEAWRLFGDDELETDPILQNKPLVKRVDVRRSNPDPSTTPGREEAVPLLDRDLSGSWSLLSVKELEAEADYLEAQVNLSPLATSPSGARDEYAHPIDLASIGRLAVTRHGLYNASRCHCEQEVGDALAVAI